MSEQATTAPDTVPSAVPPSTGVPAVDTVLADLAVAFRLPLADQVAAVERGHDQLRRALDEPDQPA